MVKKHTSKSRSITNEVDDVIIINSFDGTGAFKSRKNVSNIITWMQAMGKESYELIEKVTNFIKYWKDRHSLSIGASSLCELPQSKVWMYDVHDG